MAIVLESLAKIVFMFLLIMGMVPALIWAERKGAAYIRIVRDPIARTSWAFARPGWCTR